MAKTKLQKKALLEKIDTNLKNANAAVFCAFNNLPVNEDRKLRVSLNKEAVSYQVIKKTLLEKTLLKGHISNVPAELSFLRGNIGLAASSDEVAPAKIVAAFAKGKQDFKIVGGILNQVWVDAEKIMALAKLSPKLELIAQTVGTIKAPLTGFVNILAGNLRGLVTALNAIKDKK